MSFLSPKIPTPPPPPPAPPPPAIRPVERDEIDKEETVGVNLSKGGHLVVITHIHTQEKQDEFFITKNADTATTSSSTPSTSN